MDRGGQESPAPLNKEEEENREKMKLRGKKLSLGGRRIA